jgi:hypothetical protein
MRAQVTHPVERMSFVMAREYRLKEGRGGRDEKDKKYKAERESKSADKKKFGVLSRKPGKARRPK